MSSLVNFLLFYENNASSYSIPFLCSLSLSLTSNFLINIAFSAPFGYSSLSNNSKTTPCECSVVEASISIITTLALFQKRYIKLLAIFSVKVQPMYKVPSRYPFEYINSN